MNPHLRNAKRTIRAFIRQYWSDQKLADVYAFNQDGKMDYIDTCGCLLGVTKSNVLHTIFEDCTEKESTLHYYEAKDLPGAILAERAYASLYHVWGSERPGVDMAQPRLSAILRAEIRRRDRASRPAERTQEPISNSLVTV